VVRFDQLATDLRAGSLPAFGWITPNLCDDMHDCSVAVGDQYLSRTIPELEKNLGPRGLIILTWDEGTSEAGCCQQKARGGHIPLILVGPGVKPGGRSNVALSHYSTLRSIEEIFGLPLLREAGCACTNPLDSLFQAKPA